MKRSPLKRGKRLERRGWLRTRPSRRTRGVVEREASLLWKEAVGPCQICPLEGGKCSGPVQGHHAIPQQTLKNRGFHPFLWDTRNKVDVCEYRHEQITTAYKPLPLILLPTPVFKFAAELGLGWYLERHYGAQAESAA